MTPGGRDATPEGAPRVSGHLEFAEETGYNENVQAVKTGARMVRFSPLVSLVPMIVGLYIGGSLMRPRLGDYR